MFPFLKTKSRIRINWRMYFKARLKKLVSITELLNASNFFISRIVCGSASIDRMLLECMIVESLSTRQVESYILNWSWPYTKLIRSIQAWMFFKASLVSLLPKKCSLLRSLLSSLSYMIEWKVPRRGNFLDRIEETTFC